jgi:tetratricopeptide (TPR) repeat protein
MHPAQFVSAVAFLFLPLGVGAQAREIHWIRSYAEGMKIAQERSLAALVDFWSASSGACRKMDREVYRDPKVVQASDRAVLIRVDMAHDRETPRRLGVRRVPFLLVLDPWETVLTSKVGEADTAELLAMLDPLPASFAPVARDFAALRRNDADFGALTGIGRFYRRSGFPLVAKQFFDRALASPRVREDRGASFEVQIDLGLVALGLKEYKDARKIFEGLRENCDPRYEPEVLLGLGRAYAESDMLKEARILFEEVAIRFPKTEYAKVALENLRMIR